MRQDTRDRTLPLPVAFALAIAAHGGVFAVLAHARSEGGRLPVIRGEIAPEDINAPHEDTPDEDEVALGIDADTPSSMTWIGFEQYEEHLARLSEVEQPALDENPSGGGGGSTPTELVTPQPSTSGTDTATEVAAAQPSSAPTTADPAAAAEAATVAAAAASAGTAVDQTPAAAEAADAAASADATPPSVAPPATTPTEVASSATPPTVAPDGSLPLVATPVTPSIGVWAFGRSTPDDAPPIADGVVAAQPDAAGTSGIARTDGDADAERDVTAEAPKPAESLEGTTTAAAPAGTPTDGAAAAAPPIAPPTPATAAAASSPPSAPGPVGNSPNTNGNQSDRESDPTSLVDVPPDQWKRGKPLAARGIEIKTRRPVFPELTRLTSAPANPIVEILFDRAGVPRKARVLKSSGDPRIDGPVIDSLYRWRASGESLSRLREGETLRIEMRLLLGG